MAEEDRMPEVMAKHAITRRNGKVFEDIKPGTNFRPLDQDEMDGLRASGSIFESRDEYEMQRRAVQGIMARPSQHGIVKRPIPLEHLRKEAAHAADEALADQLGMPTKQEGEDDGDGVRDPRTPVQAAGVDVGSVAARRAGRRSAEQPRRDVV